MKLNRMKSKNKIDVKLIESFNDIPRHWYGMVAVPLVNDRKVEPPYSHRFIRFIELNNGICVALYDNKFFPEMNNFAKTSIFQ
jgi:hypothetical protein